MELKRWKIKAKLQGEAGLALSDQTRAMAVQAEEMLRPYGKSILDAAEFYLEHLKAQQSANVASLIEDYLCSKAREQVSSRHLYDLRKRLSRFGDAFGDYAVKAVTAKDIEDWLHGLPNRRGGVLAPQTVNNWRSVVYSFFQSLVNRKVIEANPVGDVGKIKVVGNAPPIFAPEDLLRLLEGAPTHLLPCLAIGAFAGLRTAEILRLEWPDVDLRRGSILVKANKAKSAKRRLVKILPNLMEWLAPWVGRTGKVWPTGFRSFHKAAARLCERTGVTWQGNGLRHSFASYHLAQYRDASALALEMGHTTSLMLFDHCREVVTPEAAERYWKIRPAADGTNVVSLLEGKKAA